MNVKITGLTADVTSRMKDKASQKVAKFMKFYDRITWVDVKLGVDQERRTVEVSAGLNRGTTIVGKAESHDMYAAIDLATDKIARQLRKHKEKLKDHRTKKTDSPPPSADEDNEPSFEEAIREELQED